MTVLALLAEGNEGGVAVANPASVECAHCGREFTPAPRARPGARPRYCGRTCRQRAYELRKAVPELAELRREVRSLRRVNAMLREELRKLGWTSRI
jgi:hypothetical protein